MFRVTRKMESYNRVNSPFSADNVFRVQYMYKPRRIASRTGAAAYLYIRAHYCTGARAHAPAREKLPSGTGGRI